MLLVLAHFGGAHWITYILYCLPLLVCVGLVVISVVSDRRQSDEVPASERAVNGEESDL